MAQITLLTGPERRRRWSADERRRILAAAFAPGAVVADAARQFEVSTSLIYKWRQQGLAAEPAAALYPPGEGRLPVTERTAHKDACTDVATGGDALRTVCDLGLTELHAIEPPRGFGRD